MPVTLSQIFTIITAPQRQALAVRAERHTSAIHAGLEGQSSLPVALSQIFTVSPLLSDARRWPSGLNATLGNPAGSLRDNSSLPVALSQIFTVSFHLPEARRWPSGLKATLLTSSVSPLRVSASEWWHKR